MAFPVRRTLAGVAAGALLAGGAAAQETGAAAPERPNILIIMADDLGYSDLGAFGGEIASPNLDLLASQGLMFTNFYGAASCAPSRAQLLTGVDNNLAGVGIHFENRRGNARERPTTYQGYLRTDTATIAEILGAEGYRTIMASKWHLGWEDGLYPDDHGFEQSFGLVQGGAAHFKQQNMAGGPGWDTTFVRNGEVIANDSLPDDYYSSTYFAQFIIDHIGDGSSEAPFMAWLGFTAPHWPLQAPAEYIERYRGRYDAGYEAIMAERLARQAQLGLDTVFSPTEPVFTDNVAPWAELSEEEQAISARNMEVYAGMVTALDHEVGRVLDHLRAIGEYDNTIIVFLSDNGAEGSMFASANSNFTRSFDTSVENRGLANSFIMYGSAWSQVGTIPYHYYKLTGFGGGNHVPAFIHYPAMVEAGRTDAVAGTVDILPTLLEMVGIDHPGDGLMGEAVVPVDGVSLMSLIRGDADAVRPDDYVWGFQILSNASLHYGDWRLVWSGRRAGNDWWLSDMASPRGERDNLAAENPEMLAMMLRLWRAYAEEQGISIDAQTLAPVNPAFN